MSPLFGMKTPRIKSSNVDLPDPDGPTIATWLPGLIVKLKLFKVNKEHFELINRIQTLIYYIIVFLLVIGFISYGGEIHDTVRKSKNLTWIDVITDTSICKLENRKNFLHYLKVGLGLKI